MQRLFRPIRRNAPGFFTEREAAKIFLSKEARTKDGKKIDIGLNIGGAYPALKEQLKHVDFIGLFRTEFLYMQSESIPSEEAQFRAYREVLAAAGDKPVTLRTLDIGGDKAVSCLDIPHEANPFLGIRALRYCFEHTDIFRTQLRAALRAARCGCLWVMFPMIGSLEDFRRAKQFLLQSVQELKKEGIPFCPDIKIGIMVEIPAAAVTADRLAREADFASIGTNDLFQYTLAADRGNPDVAPYCRTYDPAVWRLIGNVIKAFDAAGKPVSVCGELGGDPMAAMLMIGLGLRKLSMNFSSVPLVKAKLSHHTEQELRDMALHVLQADTAGEIEHILLEKLK
jgi:phosphotransferase system enzyme I (PtsI)